MNLSVRPKASKFGRFRRWFLRTNISAKVLFICVFHSVNCAIFYRWTNAMCLCLKERSNKSIQILSSTFAFVILFHEELVNNQLRNLIWQTLYRIKALTEMSSVKRSTYPRHFLANVRTKWYLCWNRKKYKPQNKFVVYHSYWKWWLVHNECTKWMRWYLVLLVYIIFYFTHIMNASAFMIDTKEWVWNSIKS